MQHAEADAHAEREQALLSQRRPSRPARPERVAAAARCGLARPHRRRRDLRSSRGPPVLADLVWSPVTLPTGADDAGGPPSFKFYGLRDNLLGMAQNFIEGCREQGFLLPPDVRRSGQVVGEVHRGSWMSMRVQQR